VGTTCDGIKFFGDETVRKKLVNLRPTPIGMELKKGDGRDNVSCTTDPVPPMPSPLPVRTPTNFDSPRSPVTGGDRWQPPEGGNPPPPSRAQQQQQSSTVVR
jgi:hypothetical protein